jgi:hypothetical protein
MHSSEPVTSTIPLCAPRESNCASQTAANRGWAVVLLLLSGAAIVSSALISLAPPSGVQSAMDWTELAVAKRLGRAALAAPSHQDRSLEQLLDYPLGTMERVAGDMQRDVADWLPGQGERLSSARQHQAINLGCPDAGVPGGPRRPPAARIGTRASGASPRSAARWCERE